MDLKYCDTVRDIKKCKWRQGQTWNSSFYLYFEALEGTANIPFIQAPKISNGGNRHNFGEKSYNYHALARKYTTE